MSLQGWRPDRRGVGCPAEGVLVERSRRIPDDTAWQAFGVRPCMSREHMELSPGWVLLAQTIQWCCENGRHEFDFMRGDEEYKYRFGGVNKHVMRVRLTK